MKEIPIPVYPDYTVLWKRVLANPFSPERLIKHKLHYPKSIAGRIQVHEINPFSTRLSRI
jgi:hypothetical protein